jgi:hypothetical protein
MDDLALAEPMLCDRRSILTTSSGLLLHALDPDEIRV